MSSIIKEHETTRIKLKAFSNALAELDEIYQGMSIMQMRVFAAIATHPSISGSELAVLLSTSTPNISRCVELLCIGKSNRRKATGLGLVEYKIDTEDKRRHILTLTFTGRLMAKVISIQLNGTSSTHST